jgi:hypothetical protein
MLRGETKAEDATRGEVVGVQGGPFMAGNESTKSPQVTDFNALIDTGNGPAEFELWIQTAAAAEEEEKKGEDDDGEVSKTKVT